MKTHPLPKLFWTCAIAATAAGCASAPSRFYTLNSTATADGAPPVNCAVVVGPVSIPAAVDRPQFTLQVATNRVAIDEFNRWAAPLDESIARVVTADLIVLLGTPQVSTARLAGFNPAYRVTIDIQRFESVRGQSALVEAAWVVRPTAGGAARAGHTIASEPTQGDSFDALAAAHSRALAKLSADIAAAIRSEAAGKPSTGADQ
jgi:uncharacterized lipoprotein YmbA